MPGTPTERWLLWWRSKSYLPSFSHISALAPAGAASRKSKDVACPLAGAEDEEAAAADVPGASDG